MSTESEEFSHWLEQLMHNGKPSVLEVLAVTEPEPADAEVNEVAAELGIDL